MISLLLLAVIGNAVWMGELLFLRGWDGAAWMERTMQPGGSKISKILPEVNGCVHFEFKP